MRAIAISSAICNKIKFRYRSTSSLRNNSTFATTNPSNYYCEAIILLFIKRNRSKISRRYYGRESASAVNPKPCGIRLCGQ